MTELDDKIESALGADSYTEEALNASRISSSSREYNNIHFVVHPGWAAANYDEKWEEERRMDIFLQKFYPDYVNDLGNDLDSASGRGEPIHVIYDSGGKSHAETLIDSITAEKPEVLGYTKSIKQSGSIPKHNLPDIEESLEPLTEDGEAVVHGEIRGRCDRLFKDELEDIDTDLNIRKGTTFPPTPTRNYFFRD